MHQIQRLNELSGELPNPLPNRIAYVRHKLVILRLHLLGQARALQRENNPHWHSIETAAKRVGAIHVLLEK